MRYGFGMTTRTKVARRQTHSPGTGKALALNNLPEERLGKSQITVRLDPENVDFLDELVAEGPSTSRADALNRILRRERRRYRVMKDDQRLRQEGETPQLSGIETVAQRVPLAD